MYPNHLKNGLRMLMLEDMAADAELIEDELRSAGIAFTSRRVEDREHYLIALKEFSPDLILADYSLPEFDGVSALSEAREQIPDVPFIFVTGALGEERAVELLKSGATDFVLKNHLSRLPLAVTRAMEEAGEKRRRKLAEKQLRSAHRELEETVDELRRQAQMLELAHDAILIRDVGGRIVYWSTEIGRAHV